MLTPSFNICRAIQNRSIHGNAATKNSSLERKLTRWLCLSERALLKELLNSEDDAIKAFCYPTISRKLSLKNMLKIFTTHPALSEQLIQKRVFQDYLNSISSDEFFVFFNDHRNGIGFVNKIKGNPSFIEFENKMKEDLRFKQVLVLQKLGMFQLHEIYENIDFFNLDDIAVKLCLEKIELILNNPIFNADPDMNFVKSMFEGEPDMDFVETIKFTLNTIKEPLQTPHLLLDQLHTLPYETIYMLGMIFPSIAEKLFYDPELVSKMDEQLDESCFLGMGTAHENVAERLIQKYFPIFSILNWANALVLSNIVGGHSHLAKAVFKKIQIGIQDSNIHQINTISFTAHLFVDCIKAKQPAIAQEILEDPKFKWLEDDLKTCLKNTVSLWETMQAICLDLKKPKVDVLNGEIESSGPVSHKRKRD